MTTGIVIRKLSKTYRSSRTPALDKLSLSVRQGEVYGFLGANGAGKTTTIRLLMNFIEPTGGRARIMGLDSVEDSVAIKRHVGYLSGDVALWPKVTGRELFAYLSRLQQRDNRQYLAELIQRFEAEPDRKIAELSKGNRQKIGIIQALMHQPDVLILDEPTSGLDPLMQEVFYQIVREACDRGAAVFVSSHNLAEVQRMCDRVGIIKHGRLIREQAIKGNTALDNPTFRIILADAHEVAKLQAAKGLQVLSVEGTAVTVRPTGPIAKALSALSGCTIVTMSSDEPNLEDDFLEYYGDKV